MLLLIGDVVFDRDFILEDFCCFDFFDDFWLFVNELLFCIVFNFGFCVSFDVMVVVVEDCGFKVMILLVLLLLFEKLGGVVMGWSFDFWFYLIVCFSDFLDLFSEKLWFWGKLRDWLLWVINNELMSLDLVGLVFFFSCFLMSFLWINLLSWAFLLISVWLLDLFLELIVWLMGILFFMILVGGGGCNIYLWVFLIGVLLLIMGGW